ncbi:hypothetical protein [Acrocarpospora sp. B8E8]|uniref:hypothetical protein n=1 Tax=Acrocarpospora sp. B8E8 TaxID=3153572 RepID=UPI00325D0DDE
MDRTTLNAAVRRFPLLGRPRPACPSLPERVAEIAHIAEAAAQSHGIDTMAEAAHALNKAALLASDCGLPEHARDLCWRHINLYRQPGTRLTVLQARYLLEPVLNLARLQLRAEDGDPALRLVEAMYRAVTANTDLVVDGHTLPLADLTGTWEEHYRLREWVWLHYVGDGIRALTLADRWEEAVTHATTHRGIGLHLMEGRQAAIIAPLLRGELSVARALLEESTPTRPWEQQVASCLTVMCTDPDKTSAARNITTMIEHFLGSEPVPGYAVFRARLGLTVVTLASDADPAAAAHVLARVAREAIEADDGYAARDVLGYRSVLIRLANVQREALSALVTSSGLGAGSVSAPLLDSLISSTKVAEVAMAVWTKSWTSAWMRSTSPARTPTR